MRCSLCFTRNEIIVVGNVNIPRVNFRANEEARDFGMECNKRNKFTALVVQVIHISRLANSRSESDSEMDRIRYYSLNISDSLPRGYGGVGKILSAMR